MSGVKEVGIVRCCFKPTRQISANRAQNVVQMALLAMVLFGNQNQSHSRNALP